MEYKEGSTLLQLAPNALLTPLRQLQYGKLQDSALCRSAFEMKFLSATALVAASLINAVRADGTKSVPSERSLD
jgi:hypothetical protein